ncbi:MAG: class I SAM-dependent methyltransferase [Actinomycetota bacterium]
MGTTGTFLRNYYVKAARSARTLSVKTGLLDRLDLSYQSKPRGLFAHWRTLYAIHDVDDLVKLDIPWWTYGAISAVQEHLQLLGGSARVFEFGSGASTVWLARRSADVYSVEHDHAFADIMRRVLADANVTDAVDLIEAPPATSADPQVRSGRPGEDELDFSGYVDALERVGGKFDLICVDGRARVACALAAVKYLTPDGILVWDDSQRPRYRDGMRRTGLKVHRFRGFAPSLPYPRETALLTHG